MRRSLAMLLLIVMLAGCVSGTISGPRNLDQPPSYGWTKAQVIAHWGHPYSTSYYGHAATWLYRRSYFVTMGYGNYIEAQYASVSFMDDQVVGVSY